MVEDATSRFTSGRRRSQVGTFVVGFALIGAVFLYSIAQFGWVEGEEFSAQSFQRRLFSYYEIPVVGLQLTAVERVGNNGDFENFLIAQRHVSVPKNPQDRWDLCWATRAGSEAVYGDSQILCRYLDAADDTDAEIWMEWSTEYPAAAKELWSVVTRLAEQELYILVPEMFSIAQAEPDVATAKTRYVETLTRRYVELADSRQQLDDHPSAVELYSAALEISPDFVGALQGRARSYLRLGKGDSAEADSARVRDLRPGQ